MLWVCTVNTITTQSLTAAASGQLKIVKETVPGAEPTKMFQDVIISWMFVFFVLLRLAK